MRKPGLGLVFLQRTATIHLLAKAFEYRTKRKRVYDLSG